MNHIVTAAMTLALGAGAYLMLKGPHSADVNRGVKERQKTAAVRYGDIDFEVTVAGNIEPSEQVSVRPEINGRIARLAVDIGDRVKEGAVLFTLDDKELQNQRSSSETEIDRARLDVEKADRNHERNRKLFLDKFISEELFDDSRIDYELAKNALERAQKGLLIIEEKLSKTQILAPFDCTVLLRPVSVGQAVSGSGGIGGGTEVLAIADLNHLVINAHVNQVDVIRLKVGQIVSVRIEAIFGLNVQGKIGRIAPQAIVKNGIKGFSARVLLQEIDGRVQPGMTANMTIPVHSALNVLTVPLAAVFTDQDDHYVFVRAANGSERRDIEIGVADYRQVEIVSGLQVDETVWLEQPPDHAIGAESNLAREAKKR